MSYMVYKIPKSANVESIDGNTTLPFGRYAGKTASEVAAADPKYLSELAQLNPSLKFSPELTKQLGESPE
jgi:hypothetical protein